MKKALLWSSFFNRNLPKFRPIWSHVDVLRLLFKAVKGKFTSESETVLVDATKGMKKQRMVQQEEMLKRLISHLSHFFEN
jgi:hypothetical protein